MGGFYKTAILWNLNGLPLQTFKSDSSAITCASIAPNGRSISAGNLEGHLLIFQNLVTNYFPDDKAPEFTEEEKEKYGIRFELPGFKKNKRKRNPVGQDRFIIW